MNISEALKKKLFLILGVSIKRFEDRLGEVLKRQNELIDQQTKMLRRQDDLINQQKEMIQRQDSQLEFLQKQLREARDREQALLTRARENDRKVTAIKSQMNAMEVMLSSQSIGTVRIERTPRIIVSMTSYPARIRFVPITMERLLNQTLKPDKIILWLSMDQFPNREEDLPFRLVDMKKRGLEIEWCEGDLKAYKKLLPALKKYPDDLIVTIDDDLIYDVDLIENLYEAHRMYPHSVIASRVHKIKYDENGNIKPYFDWEKEIDYDFYNPKQDLFVTGGAGTLYAPGVFDDDVLDVEKIRKLCPYADDVWINAMIAMQETPVVYTGKNRWLRCIPGTQDERLYDINLTENDVQIQRLVDYYGEKIGRYKCNSDSKLTFYG
ncbi:MAG: hypothetical protein LUE65_00615 [Clostridiales bacterium]|nr:hypothetical protein [Clostridiales bacterium]